MDRVRLGLVGFGTVGASFYRLLASNAGEFARRLGVADGDRLLVVSGTMDRIHQRYHLVPALGRLLAEGGADVVTGGYGGAMAACSRGASLAGGHVVGVTVELFERRGPANRWVAERVHTRDLFERLLPIFAFANQHLDISIHFFKRLLHAQGIYPTPAVRSPIFPFDEAHERITQELIARACALEAELAGCSKPQYYQSEG